MEGTNRLNGSSSILRILALSRNQHHIYEPIESIASSEALEICETEKWDAQTVIENMPDILLTPTCSSFEVAQCIQTAQHLGIPSLLLVDGILEWRNEWENPRFGFGGNLLHDLPITTDKIACLGWLSNLIYESWGNQGKSEIIGSPRFDHYLCKPIRKHEPHVPRRLLVLTANTPGFTQSQRDLIEQSLYDLSKALVERPNWELVWRVTKGLDAKLGLVDRYPEFRGKSLREVLEQVDAVITTPSTVLLEAMLMGLPCALIDYTNSPQYVQAAWTITAKQHILQVVDSLFQPDAKRMLFQDAILHINLECRSPAIPRLLKLMREMVRIARHAREQSTVPQYPYRIISQPIPLIDPSQHLDFSKLYPEHPVFSKIDVINLQLELLYAKQEMERLRKLVKTRTIGYWISVMGRRMYQSIKKPGRARQ